LIIFAKFLASSIEEVYGPSKREKNSRQWNAVLVETELPEVCDLYSFYLASVVSSSYPYRWFFPNECSNCLLES